MLGCLGGRDVRIAGCPAGVGQRAGRRGRADSICRRDHRGCSGARVWGVVRAQVITVYLLVFYGGLAAGSIAWGLAAERIGVGAALLASGVWTAASQVLAVRYPGLFSSGCLIVLSRSHERVPSR